ncbi:MAG: site-2 protease family protein, partial [Anaerolineae bacterium]|nr:site-2 protease family protein [Anaerolineae bacterium]
MTDFLLSNDFITGIIAFLLVLIPAVIIHEIGHFLAAKAVGITILEFGIGMPPRMVTLFTRAGTEYTLNWLPLGGFV